MKHVPLYLTDDCYQRYRELSLKMSGYIAKGRPAPSNLRNQYYGLAMAIADMVLAAIDDKDFYDEQEKGEESGHQD